MGGPVIGKSFRRFQGFELPGKLVDLYWLLNILSIKDLSMQEKHNRDANFLRV